MKQSIFEFASFASSEPLGIIRDPPRLLVGRHPVWLQTVLAHAELFRRVGGLDPRLRYSEDHDLLFRASLLTHFCYVGMPMVLIDRSPACIRHTGASEDWHKVDFCLRMDQYRFEKQLSLGAELSEQTRSLIRGNLRATHSHWANWYLGRREYGKARQAARAAAHYRHTLAAMVKWLLISVAPAISRKIFIARDSGSTRYDRTSWLTDTSDAGVTSSAP